jgi:type II secretory pathway component GspD/PulD (secretin)
LFREEAQQELGLSEEQIEKVRELSANARPSREELEPFTDRMRAAGEDEAEREKIRAEMEALNQKKAAAAEKELETLIGAEKVARLRQLNLQFEGSRALTGDEDLQQELGLSEDQLAQLEELRDQQRDARRDLGFRAPDDERQQFDREWNQKIFAVLSDEQRQKWEQKAGEIIVSNGVPGARSAAAPSTSNSEPGAPAVGSAATEEPDTDPPNIADPLIRPDGNQGERIASFKPIAPEKDAPAVVAQVDDREKPLSADEPSESTDEPKKELKPLPQNDAVGLGSLPDAKVKKVSFNFRYAPWEEVLKMFAEISGLTLDLVNEPPGTFNYYDDREYTPVEALDVLNGYLMQKGYMLVRRNQFLVVLNIDNGIPPNLIPNVPLDELNERGRNELMRIRVPLQGIEANIAAREVDPLLGPQGSVVPLATSNSLLITDIGDNLRAIVQLLESVTTKEDPEEIIFQQFEIEFISAAEAESMVKAQWGLSAVPQNVSAFLNDRDRDRRGPTSSSESGDISITSDKRTNSLLVNAPRKEMKLIEGLIAAIDVGDKPYDPTTDPGLNNEPYLKVYTLQNADAREVTKTLSAMLPEGVVVNEDGRERQVHIFGNDEMQSKVAELIDQLDTSDFDIVLDVIFLNKLDPVGAAAMLDALFYVDGDRAPVIEPDSFGRRLNVRGTHEQITQIKTFLAKYGESGEADSSGRGRMRIFSAGNRDPAEMLQVLQQLWSQQQAPNRIRVSIPSQSSRVKGEYVPSKQGLPTEAGEEESSPAAERPAPDSFREQMIRELERAITSSETNALDQALQETDEEVQQAIEQPEPILDLTPASERNKTSAPADDGGAAPASEGTDLLDELDRRLGNETETNRNAANNGGEPEISILLQGDKFIFTSEDEEALDQIEELLQAIGMAFPPQQDWTIFYLQSTDATEVAYTLEQLIPDSAVSSTTSSSDGSLMGELTSGLLGLGESVADASGLSSLTESSTSLRIIPETRLNALFVSGPNHLVAEVEEFLRFLDASDLPESLRDRLPRPIPVEYADVNEVYNIVSEVYKDYLSTGNPLAGNNNNRNNPLAAMLGQGGGGRGRGNNARPQLAKLTLGVDERTSQLIVSASDALYREIEELVKTVDQSAKDANATVRLIRLEQADPYMVQQTLTQLLPRVKVSSTATTRNQQQQQGRDDDNNRNRDNNDAQRQQQEAFQRMMQLRNQQQGGGNRGGGSPFGNRGGGGDRGGRGGGGFGGNRGGRGGR